MYYKTTWILRSLLVASATRGFRLSERGMQWWSRTVRSFGIRGEGLGSGRQQVRHQEERPTPTLEVYQVWIWVLHSVSSEFSWFE